MFIGHYAIVLGAKKVVPDVSLGILFLACQLADLIWPNLVLLGIESFEVEPGNTVMTPLNFINYPYSHSLVGLAVWGALFAGCYAVIRHKQIKHILVITIVVMSHWFLDYVTHRPDMPLSFSASNLFGLGLWNTPAIAIPLELILFGVGLWLYARKTQAKDKIGQYGFWGLAAFLLFVYVGNIFGPPPPSVMAVAWSAQALWLMVIWAFWVDRHRNYVNQFK